MSKAREILEEYHKAPISTMTSEGTTYSVDEALQKLRNLVEGERKPQDIHAGHTFDENWCYNCQRIVDEDSDEWRNVGNAIHNSAISKISALLGGE